MDSLRKVSRADVEQMIAGAKRFRRNSPKGQQAERDAARLLDQGEIDLASFEAETALEEAKRVNR